MEHLLKAVFLLIGASVFMGCGDERNATDSEIFACWASWEDTPRRNGCIEVHDNPSEPALDIEGYIK